MPTWMLLESETSEGQIDDQRLGSFTVFDGDAGTPTKAQLDEAARQLAERRGIAAREGGAIHAYAIPLDEAFMVHYKIEPLVTRQFGSEGRR